MILIPFELEFHIFHHLKTESTGTDNMAFFHPNRIHDVIKPQKRKIIKSLSCAKIIL